jgi:tetratricopeptide (TPR) repeat protein
VQYLERLAADVNGDLGLAQQIANGYWRVAHIQGMPTDLNLGDTAKADQSLREAERLVGIVLAERPRDREAAHLAADIVHDRMILAQSDMRDAESLTLARQAIARFDTFIELGGLSDGERGDIVTSLDNVGLALLNLHRPGEALEQIQRALTVARTLNDGRTRVGGTLSLMASAYRQQGNLDEALRAIVEARAVAEGATFKSGTARMIELYAVLLRQGLILGEDAGVSLGRSAEPVEPLQKAFDLTDAAAREDAHDAASRGRAGTAGRELGNIVRHSDPARALAIYDAAIGRLAEMSNNVKAERDRAITLAESSYALRALHRLPEARQRITQALAILAKTKDLPAGNIELDSAACAVLRAQADDLDEQGDSTLALKVAMDLIERVNSASPQSDVDLSDATALSRLCRTAARIAEHAGATDVARSLKSRRLDLWRGWATRMPGNAFITRQLEP